MVLQAAGAEQVLSIAPERARAALIAVQDTGRDAIAELRRTVRILRTDDKPTPPPPEFGPEVSPVWTLARWTISWPWWADILLAVGIVAAVDGSVFGNGPPLLIVAAVGAAIAIALRRRHPVAALALATIEMVVLTVAGILSDEAASAGVAVLVTLYTLAVHAPVRQACVGAAVAIITLEIVVVAAGHPEGLAPIAVFTTAVWATGLPEGAAWRQTTRLQEMAARLARERDALARLAALDERSRIARDLHDSVAHTVSVMVLQAGAAEQVLASAPDKARAAARAVDAKGRDALGELRELLGVLHDDEKAPRAPQPSLTDLDALIAEVVRTGLPVELRVHGKPSTVPIGVDVSAYRIIQEALTNALKHAGPVPTTVTLDYTPDAVTVEILDHGNGTSERPTDSPGHGLIGMRERVALYHGELHTGPRREAGYMVRARLPLPHISP